MIKARNVAIRAVADKKASDYDSMVAALRGCWDALGHLDRSIIMEQQILDNSQMLLDEAFQKLVLAGIPSDAVHKTPLQCCQR